MSLTLTDLSPGTLYRIVECPEYPAAVGDVVLTTAMCEFLIHMDGEYCASLSDLVDEAEGAWKFERLPEGTYLHLRQGKLGTSASCQVDEFLA